MVGENHRTIFASASFLGRVSEQKKQKRSTHGWKLRYEALRFQPPLDYAALAAAVKGQMNAKDAPLTAAARAQEQCRYFLT